VPIEVTSPTEPAQPSIFADAPADPFSQSPPRGIQEVLRVAPRVELDFNQTSEIGDASGSGAKVGAKVGVGGLIDLPSQSGAVAGTKSTLTGEAVSGEAVSGETIQGDAVPGESPADRVVRVRGQNLGTLGTELASNLTTAADPRSAENALLTRRRKHMSRIPLLLLGMAIATAGSGYLAYKMKLVPVILRASLEFVGMDKMSESDRRDLQREINTQINQEFSALRKMSEEFIPADARTNPAGLGFLANTGKIDDDARLTAILQSATFDTASPGLLRFTLVSDADQKQADRDRLLALVNAVKKLNDGRSSSYAVLEDRISKSQRQVASLSRDMDAMRKQRDELRQVAETRGSQRELDALREKITLAQQKADELSRDRLAAEADFKRVQDELDPAGATSGATSDSGSGDGSTQSDSALETVSDAPSRVNADEAHIADDALLPSGELAPSTSSTSTSSTPTSSTSTRPTASIFPLFELPPLPDSPADSSAGTSTPIGAALGAALVAVSGPDPILSQLLAERDAQLARIERLASANTLATPVDAARQGLDEALKGFEKDVEQARTRLLDRPDVMSYINQGQALLNQVRAMTDTMVRRQEQQLTRLGELKRQLDQLTTQQRRETIDGDPQLADWTRQLQMVEKQLNAAVAYKLDDDIRRLRADVSVLQSMIAAKRETLGDPATIRVAERLQSLIVDTENQMRGDRAESEKLFVQMQSDFVARQPSIDTLPPEQKEAMNKLTSRLSEVAKARQSLGEITAAETQKTSTDNSKQIALAQDRVDEIDKSISRRKDDLQALDRQIAQSQERRRRSAEMLELTRTRVELARQNQSDAEKTLLATRVAFEDADRAYQRASEAGQQVESLNDDLMRMGDENQKIAARVKEDSAQLLKLAVPRPPSADSILEQGSTDNRMDVALATAGFVFLLFCLWIIHELRQANQLASRDLSQESRSGPLPKSPVALPGGRSAHA